MFRYDRMNLLAKEKGISKAHICRELGKSPYYLRDAENADTDIRGDALEKIAFLLGTTPDYLAGKTDEKTPDIPYSPISVNDIKAALWRDDKDIPQEDIDELWDELIAFKEFKTEQLKKRRRKEKS